MNVARLREKTISRTPKPLSSPPTLPLPKHTTLWQVVSRPTWRVQRDDTLAGHTPRALCWQRQRGCYGRYRGGGGGEGSESVICVPVCHLSSVWHPVEWSGQEVPTKCLAVGVREWGLKSVPHSHPNTTTCWLCAGSSRRHGGGIAWRRASCDL